MPGFLQNVAARVNRERRIVLLSGEPLFLRGGNDLPVDEHRRRTVVIVRGDAKDCFFHLIPFCRCSLTMRDKLRTACR